MPYETIKAKDGSGDFNAYVALPASEAPVAAIILIQEIFGVNTELRKKCDLWAERGYIAIAPDLFWRQEPGVDITDQSEKEWEKAFSLYQGFDHDKGIEDLTATLGHIRAHALCNGKVGTIGYCLGGNLAYQMACKTNINASISYYGVGIQDLLEEAQGINKPLLMHIATQDEFVPPEAQKAIKEALSGNEHVTIYDYGANHAFTRLNGVHFDENAAKVANNHSLDFIQGYLS